MKDRRLALRYARALLSALPQPDAAERADGLLTALASEMEASAEFRRFLLDPAVGREERAEALRQLVQRAGASPEVGRFFDTLVQHQRLGALPAIAAVFHERRQAAAGIVPAEMTTAEPMPPELRDRAVQALRRLTGRDVRLEFRVDPLLLGGAVTRIGSTVYDGSLRTQLSQLRREMTQE